MDLITQSNSPLLPPSLTFHAKEEHKYDTITSSIFEYKDFLLFESTESEPNLVPGDPEMIWNFTASDTPPQQQIGTTKALLWHEPITGVLLNGRNVKWGSLEICNFHARIDRLFDRDLVWAATQTMVSFGKLASWAIVAGDWH